jgi:hypothetical protein
MYHPAKPWQMPFSQLVNVHNVTRVAPDIFGGISLNPLTDMFRNPGGDGPLKGAFLFVRDQRASGINAVLWRDPSMIL